MSSINAGRFSDFYEEGLPRTIRFLLSLGFPRDEAAEIAQASWAMAWERLDQLRDDDRLLSWVNTIALNAARKSIRRAKQQTSLRPEGNECLTSQNVAAIDVNIIFNRLPPKDRSLLEAQLKGTSNAELAAEQGISLMAMRLRAFRARQAARELCRQAAGSDDQTEHRLQTLTTKFHDQCLMFARQYSDNAATLLKLLGLTTDDQKRSKLQNQIRKSIQRGLKSLGSIPASPGRFRCTDPL